MHGYFGGEIRLLFHVRNSVAAVLYFNVQRSGRKEIANSIVPCIRAAKEKAGYIKVSRRRNEEETRVK